FMLYFMFIRQFSFYLEEGGIAREAFELMVVWFWVGVLGPGLFAIMMVVYTIDFYWFVGLSIFIGLLGGYWAYHYVTQWIRMLNMIASLRKVLITFYHM